MKRLEEKKLQVICGYIDELLPQFEYSKPKNGLHIVGTFNNVNTQQLLEKCDKKNIELINMASHNALEFNFKNASIHEAYSTLHSIARSI